ncbi:putative protein yyaR [Proteiniborus sp. DW1]|uniref:GNAT family N-acetyltransferase n=1 Tax=Proteiniborus sp. DW1 TaxID=1889883 RepID=UPI00092DECC5|nr:GNAT family N-acetyltransferase [Proteiniborus sp. DW1]SCG82873.1 putative protein yyaR [Proteiniborus sp. DW1]
MEIYLLDKKEYNKYKLDFKYTTKYYYDVEVDSNEVFSIKLVKKPFEKEVQKGFTGILYEDWLENPSAYVLTEEEQILGYLEVDRESWNNRLRITEILVLEDFRASGYGTVLINKAKEIAKEEGFREIILETHSCNTKAIDFYIKNGFRVNGIDLSCYTNDDVARKEVRIEMVYRLYNSVV